MDRCINNGDEVERRKLDGFIYVQKIEGDGGYLYILSSLKTQLFVARIGQHMLVPESI